MSERTETVFTWVVVVIGWTIIALSLFAMVAGCAGELPCFEHGEPYTHERPTQAFHITMTYSRGIDSWTADGAPTVLTVHNPTNKMRRVHVVCEPSVPPWYIDYGHIEGYFCLPPHTEITRLVEFMNIDAMTQVCHVADAPAEMCK